MYRVRARSARAAQQVAADIASYSAAADLLAINYDDVEMSASASLFGLGSTKAKFRPGLGCTLVRAGSEQLDDIVVPTLVESLELWPRGSMVNSLDKSMQSQLATVLAQDNAENLPFWTLQLLWPLVSPFFLRRHNRVFEKLCHETRFCTNPKAWQIS